MTCHRIQDRRPPCWKTNFKMWYTKKKSSFTLHWYRKVIKFQYRCWKFKVLQVVQFQPRNNTLIREQKKNTIGNRKKNTIEISFSKKLEERIVIKNKKTKELHYFESFRSKKKSVETNKCTSSETKWTLIWVQKTKQSQVTKNQKRIKIKSIF